LTFDGATGGLSVVDSTGDILNVVNTGTTYAVGSTTNIGGGTGSPLTGTSFTNFGCKIQGTDSSGNPSLTKLRFTGGPISMIGIREGQNYIIVQGFYIDRPASATNNTSLTFINMNDLGAGVPGPLLVQNCVDISTTLKCGFFVRDATAALTSTAAIHVQYCFIRDWFTNGGISIAGSSQRQLVVNNNVFWASLGTTPPVVVNFGTNDAAAGADHQFYNNTVICTNSRLVAISAAGTNATGANALAHTDCYSNVVAQFTASVGSDTWFTGSSTWASIPWTGVRNIGYNIFVDPGGHSWTTAHPYQVPWDPDNIDSPEGTSYYITDVNDETSGADPFNDFSTAWDWINNGYTIQLPGDLRLVQYRTSGLGGTVPGAIADALSPPSDPPDPDPGPAGLPIGPNAPGFLFDGPDGILTTVRLRKNTTLAASYRFDGEQEAITHAGVGGFQLAPAALLQNVPLLPATRVLIVETDKQVILQLNSVNVLLRPGGCLVVDGANLVTFKASNQDALATATLRFFEAY
jgi:hypothetical protein